MGWRPDQAAGSSARNTRPSHNAKGRAGWAEQGHPRLGEPALQVLLVQLVVAAIGQVCEDEPAAAAQHAGDVHDVPAGDCVACEHEVGEHIDREHEIERRIGQRCEIMTRKAGEVGARLDGAAPARLREHAAGDIDAEHFGFACRDQPAEAADAAAEIEHAHAGAQIAPSLQGVDDLAAGALQEVRIA